MVKKMVSCCDPALQSEVAFPPDLAERAGVFKALGDEARLQILHLVRDEEVCVCDLVPIIGVVQSTLSHHLSVLQRAGLVTARKQGRWNYYKATPEAVKLVSASTEVAPIEVAPMAVAHV